MIGKTVGRSWMGTSISDLIAIAAKDCVRRQRSIIDEAVRELAIDTGDGKCLEEIDTVDGDGRIAEIDAKS